MKDSFLSITAVVVKITPTVIAGNCRCTSAELTNLFSEIGEFGFLIFIKLGLLRFSKFFSLLNFSKDLDTSFGLKAKGVKSKCSTSASVLALVV